MAHFSITSSVGVHLQLHNARSPKVIEENVAAIESIVIEQAEQNSRCVGLFIGAKPGKNGESVALTPVQVEESKDQNGSPKHTRNLQVKGTLLFSQADDKTGPTGLRSKLETHCTTCSVDLNGKMPPGSVNSTDVYLKNLHSTLVRMQSDGFFVSTIIQLPNASGKVVHGMFPHTLLIVAYRPQRNGGISLTGSTRAMCGQYTIIREKIAPGRVPKPELQSNTSPEARSENEEGWVSETHDSYQAAADVVESCAKSHRKLRATLVPNKWVSSMCNLSRSKTVVLVFQQDVSQRRNTVQFVTSSTVIPVPITGKRDRKADEAGK